MSVQVSYKKQLIFGIVSLVILLLIVEAFANVWLFEINKCQFEKSEIFKDMDPQIKRELCQQFYNIQFGANEVNIQINLGGLTGIESGRIYINSEGFRGPEFSQSKDENTFRIFLIGGSTIFSAGVPDNQTVSAYLQEYFDNSDLEKKVEVINAGVGGSSSEIEVRLIKERLMYYEPDLFIVYDGWNDLERIRAPNFFSIPTTKLISTFEDQNISGKSSPELWKDRWSEICDIGKKRGFETIVILQPIAGTGERILTEQEYEYFLNHRSEDLLKPYPEYIQQLPEIREHCTQAEDMRELFDNVYEAVYYDEGHVGSLGNSIVAKKFYELSIPIIKEKGNQTKIINENSLQKNVSKDPIIREKIVKNDYSNLEFRINQFLAYHDSPEKLIDFFLERYKTPSAIASFIDEIQKNNKHVIVESDLLLTDKDFSSKEFTNKNFEHYIFKKINLEQTYIKNSNFTNAKIIESKFSSSEINDANLSEISIIRSDLSNSKIKDVEINDANIAYVNWSNSKITNVNFENTKFFNVNFENTTFNQVNLSFTDLKGQKLSDTEFIGVNLKNSYLVESNLSGMNLKNVTLEYANLNNADLSNADLSNQVLTGVSLIGANLTDSNLSNVDLSGMDLSNAILIGANLTNSNMKNVILTDTITDPSYKGCINNNLCD